MASVVRDTDWGRLAAEETADLADDLSSKLRQLSSRLSRCRAGEPLAAESATELSELATDLEIAARRADALLSDF